MSLTATAINAARPQASPYKLFDESGLYMSIEPSGGKLWRLKYRYGGKEKKLALPSVDAVIQTPSTSRFRVTNSVHQESLYSDIGVLLFEHRHFPAH
jgi:hypothetical protein